MREYATPLATEIPATGNLTDDVVANGTEHPDSTVLARPSGGGWTDVTAAEFLAEVRAVAKGLLAAGLEPGDRVALVSRTRYEWTLLDYAIWFAGCVTVPVYETSSAEQLAWVVGDSGCRAAVVETGDHLDRLGEVREGLESLQDVWCLDDGADRDPHRARRGGQRRGPGGASYDGDAAGPRDAGLHLRHDRPAEGLHADPRQLHVRARRRDRRALGSCSRTTTPPRCCSCRWPTCSPASSRSAASGNRTRLGHSADVTDLPALLGEFRPTFLLAVPRVFEKVFNTASQRATADGRGALFDRAARTAIDWSRGLERGRPGVRVRARHALFSRLVYPRLLEALGGRCRYAIAGGAPLGERLGHFYRGIGLTVLEGYGLTETHRRRDGQPPGRAEGRHRRASAPGHDRPGGRRRGAAVRRRPGLRRLLGRRRGDPRGARPPRLVAHRRRRRGRRRGLRPDHRDARRRSW